MQDLNNLTDRLKAEMFSRVKSQKDLQNKIVNPLAVELLEHSDLGPHQIAEVFMQEGLKLMATTGLFFVMQEEDRKMLDNIRDDLTENTVRAFDSYVEQYAEQRGITVPEKEKSYNEKLAEEILKENP